MIKSEIKILIKLQFVVFYVVVIDKFDSFD